ncbi:MAG: DinB family protein [Saprospiraceae bacterium]|nr:DinB family protein [Lewinella sp.]
MPIITQPAPTEYAPFFNTYVSKVDDPDAFALMERAAVETPAFLDGIPHEKWEYRYAPGKWSLKESLIHMLDTERIFSYRALRIARNDKTPLPGFEQDDYIPFYNTDQRSPESIIDEYNHIRAATLHLFRYLTPEDLNRSGTASGGSITVRALAYLITGHEIHHMRLIRERYLG